MLKVHVQRRGKNTRGDTESTEEEKEIESQKKIFCLQSSVDVCLAFHFPANRVPNVAIVNLQIRLKRRQRVKTHNRTKQH